MDNNFENNGRGLVLTRTTDDLAFHNNFVDNFIQIVSSGSGNTFDDGPIKGGNFWSNFDESVEGCNDSNNNNICDSPFVFTGGQDNFPWITQNGWEGPQAVDIEISWTLPPDFSSTTPDFVSYQIFRNTTGNVTTIDTLVETITNQNETTFIDENLDTGQTYHYRVFTFDGAGLFIGSNEESITL